MTASFRSFRFFELPTEVENGNCSVERPCLLPDQIRPPCTEYGGNRLKGVLNRAYEVRPRRLMSHAHIVRPVLGLRADLPLLRIA